MRLKSRFLRRLFRVIIALTLLITVSIVIFYFSVRVIPPLVEDKSALDKERSVINDSFFVVENSWLLKNPTGLWEAYIEGGAFERGAYYGNLCQDLLGQHEAAFIEGIKEKVPSESYLTILKYFVAWFNRHLPQYVPQEYQKEIYGLSFYKSKAYDFIGPPFHRALNYHAAHDVGHAIQNMGLVGCTSLSAWGAATEDSTLLMGRNFDFYVGDEFAALKMISFIHPDEGYRFASISWPGMCGVVSGMNIHGLAVTLNAAPSDIPQGARTPVAMLARQIVQYARNIDEAFQIADTTPTFVAENIIISSAVDNKTVVIEKTPEETRLYEPKNNHLICSNHFQHPQLKESEKNQQAKIESSSLYRYKRTQELLEANSPLSVKKIAGILRNQKGMAEKELGVGNEMAINIQIAHHSVIFQPHERKMWVAATPSQLGAYQCYDLKHIFQNPSPPRERGSVSAIEKHIPADPFLFSEQFKAFQTFRSLTETIQQAARDRQSLDASIIREYQRLNPHHYLTYLSLGEYFRALGKCQRAINYFEKGLQLPIPWADERIALEKGLKECK